MSIEHLVANAKALVAEVTRNPSLFHSPELAFLKHFHETFIAPPEAPAGGCGHGNSHGHSHSHAHAHSHDQAAPEPSRFEEASEPSEDEEEEEVRAALLSRAAACPWDHPARSRTDVCARIHPRPRRLPLPLPSGHGPRRARRRPAGRHGRSVSGGDRRRSRRSTAGQAGGHGAHEQRGLRRRDREVHHCH